MAEAPEPPVLRRRNRQASAVDMTPMVDVTFLLLIFFMVTAAFQLQKSIELPNVKSEEPSLTVEPDRDQPEMVTVHVDRFNSFTVLAPDWEREVPGKQNLINALREAISGIRSGGPVRLVVQAHVDAEHRAVVDAMDAGTETGFTELELMDVEEFDYR